MAWCSLSSVVVCVGSAHVGSSSCANLIAMDQLIDDRIVFLRCFELAHNHKSLSRVHRVHGLFSQSTHAVWEAFLLCH